MVDDAFLRLPDQRLRPDEHLGRGRGLVGEKGRQVLVFERFRPLFHRGNPEAGDDLLRDGQELRTRGVLLDDGAKLGYVLDLVFAQERA